ncbi:23S rRNA (adenine(2503)-C(2))-methyltransferase [candidate division CPR3 bacterium GWE2_35_7]|nr:MAG: putative dual-specificity RNA methyltransferase RlmN [candidate division CPR3 bacterium GW2011_GWE2_35_7]OGB80451.1 MAG: 23S rRNA (adenine(2503)-C(2))-methyltransferase [candidate division CPR3 bacterium GWE2_35_7]
MEDLQLILKKEPKYRLKQVKEAVYRDLIGNWDFALTLPLSLRKQLNEKLPLEIKAEIFDSRDQKTTKALIELQDGNKIETVLMRYSEKRNTVCVSSQVGCPLSCTFCATGKMGLIRNLTADEIVNQVLLFGRIMKKEEDKVTNIVFMGMGEPFLNYDEVIKAIKILHDPEGMNLGIRPFSLSTSGITEGIEKFALEKMEVNLAISLHSPTQELREKLMPIAKKYHLTELFKAIQSYQKITRRKVMFEYLMLQDLNDSMDQALQLSKLLRGLSCMVNLIPYNETGVYKASSTQAINNFRRILEDNYIEVAQRYRFGEDIKAACGQLAIRKKG